MNLFLVIGRFSCSIYTNTNLWMSDVVKENKRCKKFNCRNISLIILSQTRWSRQFDLNLYCSTWPNHIPLTLRNNFIIFLYLFHFYFRTKISFSLSLRFVQCLSIFGAKVFGFSASFVFFFNFTSLTLYEFIFRLPFRNCTFCLCCFFFCVRVCFCRFFVLNALWHISLA